MKIRIIISLFIFIVSILFHPYLSLSQISNTHSIKSEALPSDKNQGNPKSKKVKKAVAKSEKTLENQQNAYDKAKATDMKHRMDLQTPKTRERMKESRKLADKNNTHYHISLWQKIFGHKR